MPRISREALRAYPQDTPLDPGPYLVSIKKITPGAAGTGRKKIDIHFAIIEGPTQKAGGTGAGRIIFDTLYMPQGSDTEETAGRMNGRLNGFFNSLPDAPDSIDTDDQEDLNELLNMELGIRTRHETDKDSGEVRIRVAKYGVANA